MTTIGTTDYLRRIADRELLRYVVATAIFNPYGGGLLDIRRAVLLDGTEHAGTMHIMTAAEFDTVTTNFGGIETLKAKLGNDFEVYDGREMGFR